MTSEATAYTVLYDVPGRSRGASHALHVRGCRHLEFAQGRGGNPVDLKATNVKDALIEAQFQGLEPGEDTDLGDVDIAPCAA